MGQERRGGLKRSWVAAASFFVLALGWLEGWYGKTVAGDVYGSDAVQYLDIAKAFERGDWHAALNPLWSQGYPALLALLRPLFGPGASAEWTAIRALNFGIFVLSWVCFVGFVREMRREGSAFLWVGAVCTFVTAQICMDQVSRVGPDQLVAAIFFLVCALLLRMARRPSFQAGELLGIALGAGFVVKSIFLPLGLAAIAIAAVALTRRRKLVMVAPAATIFAVIVLGYGALLSHVVGYRTLGEAGSLNYAWHVDRLAKWVHWEGGTDAAGKAWPKPWIARFTHWQSDPPQFGRPLHASAMVGVAPTVYVFHAPVEATYAPYFDPPYFYQGYRHVLRWRYQVVAIGKNLGDFALVLLQQSFFWGLSVVLLLLWRRKEDRQALWAHVPGWISDVWPVWGLAAFGIAIYLPVHLEGRYVAAFLAVLIVVQLDSFGAIAAPSPGVARIAMAVLLVGFTAGLVKDQGGVWKRAVQHWNYREILEWREGEALRAAGLGGREVGVISWTPNVQCDWAYLADERITSEIASPADESAFWKLSQEEQAIVLLNFRQAGSDVVITRDKPAQDAIGWEQIGELPLWAYRF